MSKGLGRQGWQAAPARRIGHRALLLRVGQMLCGVGGVGVGCGTMLPRVGGLRCSVGRDNSRQWALLPGSGGMRRNVGGNCADQGPTLLFVSSASYGIEINCGSSFGIGRFGVAWVLYDALPPSCDATLKWRALAHEALLLSHDGFWMMQCYAWALLQPSNVDVKIMWSCALLAQWNRWHVMTLKWEVNLRLLAFTKGYWLAIQLCYDRCFGASALVGM